MSSIQERLFSLSEPDYRDFTAKLTPSVDPDAILGVRVPQLRALAKELRGTPQAEAFLSELPHRYYEENNLHGYLIALEPDFDRCLNRVEAFLPCIDNWATCDTLTPGVFRRHRPELRRIIPRWLASGHIYTIRFGVKMLMDHYLDKDFFPEALDWAAELRSEEYYVNMMIAWYFATALAKQPQDALPYLAEGRLPLWVHNKAIQKAVESNRIPAEQKAFLRGLRRT